MPWSPRLPAIARNSHVFPAIRHAIESAASARQSNWYFCHLHGRIFNSSAIAIASGPRPVKMHSWGANWKREYGRTGAHIGANGLRLPCKSHRVAVGHQSAVTSRHPPGGLFYQYSVPQTMEWKVFGSASCERCGIMWNENMYEKAWEAWEADTADKVSNPWHFWPPPLPPFGGKFSNSFQGPHQSQNCLITILSFANKWILVLIRFITSYNQTLI